MANRLRVLIAEDYAGVAKAVSRVLSLECDVVGSVADGSAVVEAVQRLLPDVLVLDLNLPNANGLEVCRQIKRLKLPVNVVVFTAMDDPNLRQRCIEAGASAFASKMSGDDDLVSIIKAL